MARLVYYCFRLFGSTTPINHSAFPTVGIYPTTVWSLRTNKNSYYVKCQHYMTLWTQDVKAWIHSRHSITVIITWRGTNFGLRGQGQLLWKNPHWESQWESQRDLAQDLDFLWGSWWGSWLLMMFLMRFLILNEVLAQDLIEILILEQLSLRFSMRKTNFFP